MNIQSSYGDRRRLNIFKELSRNLQQVKQHPLISFEPDFEDGVLCPICMKYFSQEGLDKKYDDCLTLEDVPPVKLGGKVRTLTCKKCNNKGGSDLESHLPRKILFDEFLKGNNLAPADGFIKLQDGTIPVSIRTDKESNIKLIYYPQRSKPEETANFFESMKRSGSDFSFQMEITSKYREGRPEIALLRIAYLYAFSVFGYGFLLNPNLQIIRKQILNPDERLLQSWGVFKNLSVPDNAVGVNILYAPKELSAFFIIFDLIHELTTNRYGVLLPGPTSPGSGIYQELTRDNNRSRLDVKFEYFPETSYISPTFSPFISFYFWQEALQKA